MFTKCPSCHTEISFDAPKNAPAGYKHRIKCPNPNCGVTISVVIPPKQGSTQNNMTQNVASQTPQQQNYTPYPIGGVAPQYPPYPPMYPPYPPYAPYNGYAPYPQQAVPQNEEKSEEEKTGRWSGSVAKAIVMLLLSFVFIAFNVIGFLIAKGTIAADTLSPLYSFTGFNGISYLATLISMGAEAFRGYGIPYSILSILSILGFLIAGLSVILNLIVAIKSSYGKGVGLTNIIFTALLFIVSITTLFIPFVKNGLSITAFAIYFQTLLTVSNITLLLGFFIGLLMLVLGIVFFFIKGKPLPKKEKKIKEKKVKDENDTTLEEKEKTDKIDKKDKKIKKDKKNKKDSQEEIQSI